jgi:hypothetical protein
MFQGFLSVAFPGYALYFLGRFIAMDGGTSLPYFRHTLATSATLLMLMIIMLPHVMASSS